MTLRPTWYGRFLYGAKFFGRHPAPDPVTPPPAGAIRVGWAAVARRRGPDPAFAIATRVASLKKG